MLLLMPCILKQDLYYNSVSVHLSNTMYLEKGASTRMKYLCLSLDKSGFRSNHSTTTGLLKMTDDIQSAMDKRQLTNPTLLDFSKAYDCVYHPLLLINLGKLGFSSGFVDCVSSYLPERQPCVKADNITSHWRPVT